MLLVDHVGHVGGRLEAERQHAQPMWDLELRVGAAACGLGLRIGSADWGCGLGLQVRRLPVRDHGGGQVGMPFSWIRIGVGPKANIVHTHQ